MALEIEGVGGVVTAGLVAGALEKPTGQAGEHEAGTCSDCGAVTTANFCANCGQPTHVHRTLLHLGEEVLHGVMHFDARIWRTLPLLAINPGRLTREWIEGKRTRYVSPLAMFLFTLFVMFFALSFMPEYEAVAPSAERIAEQRENLTEAEASLATVRTELGREEATQVGLLAVAAAEKTVAEEKAELTELETEVRDGRGDGLTPGSWQAKLKDWSDEGEVRSSGEPGKGSGYTLLKKLQNPDLALYKLQQTMYKFAFLLVPLSIPFVALLFLWRRGSTFYDHGVFVLYSLTAVSILFMGAVLLSPVWSGFAFVFGLLISFGIPVHMFAQLKGAYSLNWFSAAWRTLFLLVFANIALGLFFTAIILLGLTS